MTAGERNARKRARSVREGAVGKGPVPRAPRRRPTSPDDQGLVPYIAKKLTIKTGKNKDKHPSVASLYRAFAEAEQTASA